MNLKLTKINNSFSGNINIGGSKSISNRILIIKGLTGSNCKISNISNSDDTESLNYYVDSIDTCERSGIPMVIDVKNAGTVARFLTAFLAFHDGKWLITGSERMKQRPMKTIVDALINLGADISYGEKTGFLPLRIVGSDLKSNEITVDVSESSQFLSALLLIGPYLENGLQINITDTPVSMPYILMTQKLMQKFGAHVSITSEKAIVRHGKYKFHACSVEPDWSSASYWYEIVALSENGEIFLPGFTKSSIQGDSILADIFVHLGVATTFWLKGIKLSKTNNISKKFSFDFAGTPDIVPTVMTTCAALGVVSEFRNINQLEYKESNRIISLKNELIKIGAKLTKKGDNYILTPGDKVNKNLIFNTYNDHRIAMCLAPLVLKFGNIEIENHEIVNKSYPAYWDDFKKLNFANLKSQNK